MPQLLFLVLLIILLLLIITVAILLFLPGTVIIKYSDNISVYLKVLFLKFRLYPAKKKKVRWKKYTARYVRRRIERKRRKAERQALKQRRKLDKAPEKQKAKRTGKKQKLSFSEVLELVSSMLGTLPARLLHHAKIKIRKLNITVATDDAAKTAMAYAGISASLSYIIAFLDQHAGPKYSKNASVNVVSDFASESEKLSADIDIAFSLSLFGLSDVAIRGLMLFFGKTGRSA